MTWLDTTLPLLRAVLQDVSTSPTYGDSRLIDVLFAASHLLLSEVTFSYDYTVNLVTRTVAPDPAANTDISFMNMVVYKAALLILNSELKTSSNTGVLIKDGPSIIDTREFYKTQKSRYDLMAAEYDKIKLQIKLGDLNAGLAILSPYTRPNDPTYIWR